MVASIRPCYAMSAKGQTGVCSLIVCCRINMTSHSFWITMHSLPQPLYVLTFITLMFAAEKYSQHDGSPISIPAQSGWSFIM